jgi:hypothetical protein
VGQSLFSFISGMRSSRPRGLAAKECSETSNQILTNSTKPIIAPVSLNKTFAYSAEGFSVPRPK